MSKSRWIKEKNIVLYWSESERRTNFLIARTFVTQKAHSDRKAKEKCQAKLLLKEFSLCEEREREKVGKVFLTSLQLLSAICREIVDICGCNLLPLISVCYWHEPHIYVVSAALHNIDDISHFFINQYASPVGECVKQTSRFVDDEQEKSAMISCINFYSGRELSISSWCDFSAVSSLASHKNWPCTR